MRRQLLIAMAALAAVPMVLGVKAAMFQPSWSTDELQRIQSLSLANLPPLRPDPSNRVSDDPVAVDLGRKLFFDTRLSANGKVSCASCHQPDRQFQDGRPVGQGVAKGNRRTMPIAGTAYVPFLFWDGRKDSQWSQALGPIENPAEHGADRVMVVRLVSTAYAQEYTSNFGALPSVEGLPGHAMPGGANGLDAAWNTMTPVQQHDINRAYANMGKAIAAFERTIKPELTRFDGFASALAAGDQKRAGNLLSESERNGLRLFLGKGNCVTCHNGPLFTDNAFHNIGLPGLDPGRDRGRGASLQVVTADPFNCLGPFSDAKPTDCSELRFITAPSLSLEGAFRSPSLRGVAQRAPYMHAGQFATLRELLLHYNKAPAATFGHSELKPLGLSEQQQDDIEAFLRTLDPTSVPSNARNL